MTGHGEAARRRALDLPCTECYAPPTEFCTDGTLHEVRLRAALVAMQHDKAPEVS